MRREALINGSLKVLALLTGTLSVILGAFGLWYNVVSFRAFFRRSAEITVDVDPATFYTAYFLMSAICIFCHTTLIVAGIDTLRLKFRWSTILSSVLMFEIVYMFVVACTWMIPGIGRNIAAATGIANGGLSPQLALLFPFWAPLVLYFSKRRLNQPVSEALEHRESLS